MKAILIGVLFLTGVAVPTTAVYVLVRQFIPTAVLAPAEKSIGPIFITPTSTMYGVLVAFILAGTLSDYDTLQDTVAVELNALVNLAEIARAVPGAAGDELRSAVLAYTRSLVRDEWPHLARPDPRTSQALMRLWSAVLAAPPAESDGTTVQAAALDLVTEVASQRRLRLLEAHRETPPIVWWILTTGAAILIGYAILSTLTPGGMQAALVVGLVVVTVLPLYVIYVLQNPAPFDLAPKPIDPDSIKRILQGFGQR